MKKIDKKIDEKYFLNRIYFKGLMKNQVFFQNSSFVGSQYLVQAPTIQGFFIKFLKFYFNLNKFQERSQKNPYKSNKTQ